MPASVHSTCTFIYSSLTPSHQESNRLTSSKQHDSLSPKPAHWGKSFFWGKMKCQMDRENMNKVLSSWAPAARRGLPSTSGQGPPLPATRLSPHVGPHSHSAQRATLPTGGAPTQLPHRQQASSSASLIHTATAGIPPALQTSSLQSTQSSSSSAPAGQWPHQP